MESNLESNPENKGPLGTNIVTQVAFLVNDIEKAIKSFAALLGVDPPDCIVTGPIEETQAEYKGKPCEATAKLAFFYVGGHLTIELIEPDHTPSVWRDDLNKNGQGVHHLAFVVDGMKHVIGRLEDAGFPLVQKGEYPGGRYAYMDTNSAIHTMIELLEND